MEIEGAEIRTIDGAYDLQTDYWAEHDEEDPLGPPSPLVSAAQAYDAGLSLAQYKNKFLLATADLFSTATEAKELLEDA